MLVHGFLYNWIGKLFLPSAWLGHSLIFYNFKTIHLKLIKFDENMVLWLVNQNFEKNQVLMYHFSSNDCLRKLNLNLREKKSWFSNACNFLRETFSNLFKHELYSNWLILYKKAMILQFYAQNLWVAQSCVGSFPVQV